MFEHFITAQDRVYDDVLRELRAGDKQSHWMWFIFPQIAGLGLSAMAARFALADLDEARAYWAHPVLGVRLRDCVTLVNAIECRSAHEIFGSPDDLKFRSCLTLFALATQAPLFREALDKYYGGELDALTVKLVGA